MPDTCARSELGDFWSRSVPWWHGLFAGLVAVTALVVLVGPHPAAAIGLIPLSIAYAVLGVLAMRDDIRDDRIGRSLAYLAVAYTVLAVMVWWDPNALILLFALYAQTFALLPLRWAMPSIVVLTASYTSVLIVRDGFTREVLLDRGLAAVISLGFAVVLGLFVDGIVRQGEKQADLLAELRATQQELAAVSREAGAAGERERLAREIHDTLAQGFTSTIVLAQSAEASLGRGDIPAVSERLTRIESTARDNLAEARALIAALSPPDLAGVGLVDAVRRCAERHEADTGVPVTVEVRGEPAVLSRTGEVAALRAAQEALHNVARHAGATSVTVTISFDEDGATVTVTDDGRGFDPATVTPGFGLGGMAARAEEVGGLAAVESRPGAGTTIKVRVT